MTRDFSGRAVDQGLLDGLVDLATRAPSAGKTQGWHVVVLEGADTDRFWRHTLTPERRETFAWPGLLRAPVLMLPLADPDAYVARYGEPDKAATGLGAGVDAWPTPYWTVDTSMGVMTLLLAAEDAGLGALLFGVFRGEAALRAELGIPPSLQLLGAIALGWPATTGGGGTERSGLSAGRRRRPPAEVVHRGGW